MREEWGKRGRNNPAETKISEEGGGGAAGARAEVSLRSMKKTVVRQVVHLQPVEVRDGSDIHAAAHGGLYVIAAG